MLVGHEVDCTVDEKTEKLRQVFIAMQQLDKHEKKQELRAVGQQESSGKK